jgi:hypothetical protein
VDSNDLIQVCAMVGAVASALGAVVAFAHATQNRRRERTAPNGLPGVEPASPQRAGSAPRPVERESGGGDAGPAQVWPGSPLLATPPRPTEPPSRSARRWYQEHGTKPNGWPSDPPTTSSAPTGAPNRWWLNGFGQADPSRSAPGRQARR